MNYINNIKNKLVSHTSYKTGPYSTLWYNDDLNKVCITFTPRGGCSVSFQQYLDLVGLLSDGFKYDNFIHKYRSNIFIPNIKYKPMKELIDNNYTIIKFIMNPYIRAVSIYRVQQSHNLSFREYLKQLVNNETKYFNLSDRVHLHPQYIDGEEKFITKYIKINENEKYTIKLKNNELYTFDTSKFTSIHHGKKSDNTNFVGDLKKDIVNQNLPKSYKFFYDDEIKSLVDIFYKNDVEKYKFNFEDF